MCVCVCVYLIVQNRVVRINGIDMTAMCNVAQFGTLDNQHFGFTLNIEFTLSILSTFFLERKHTCTWHKIRSTTTAECDHRFMDLGPHKTMLIAAIRMWNP